MTIRLDPHCRGDTFSRNFTLSGDWLGTDFTGGVKFTLRTEIPASSVVTDEDAIDQASVEGGEITFDEGVGTVLIPASRTTAWPLGRLMWDLQGTVSGSPARVYTIASGVLVVVGDVTRAP